MKVFIVVIKGTFGVSEDRIDSVYLTEDLADNRIEHLHKCRDDMKTWIDIHYVMGSGE